MRHHGLREMDDCALCLSKVETLDHYFGLEDLAPQVE
jgi:hypothetical protein